MKRTDLVRVKQYLVSAGQSGLILEMSKGFANVYWHSGKVYWIEVEKLEVVSNENA
tara:strand:+ start:34 stop:201 length:168 start_codon:yes stop_codon:yes gene_type:complete